MLHKHVHNVLCSQKVLISSFNHGCKDGYLQAAVPLFMSNSPFPISTTYISWIASISFCGTILAVFIRYLLRDKISRQRFLIGCTVMSSVTWFLILTTNSAIITIVSLFLYGAASNIIAIIGHVYFAEIAMPENRELLGIIFALLYALGTQLEFPLSVFQNYRLLAFFPFIISLLNMSVGLFMIESPYSLIMQNKDEKALKNLSWLFEKSLASTDISKELQYMKKYISEQRTRKVSDSRILCITENLKLLTIIVLIDLATMINCDTILITHGSLILKSFEPIISGSWFSSVRATVMLCGSILSWLTVKKFDRRTILFYGHSMAGGIQLLLAYCYYIEERNENYKGQYLAFLIVTLLLTFVILCSSVNETTIDILISEIFPHTMKENYVSLVEICRDLVGFAVVISYIPLANMLGIHMLLFLYSMFAFLSVVLIYLYIPDTKGKTLYEIRQIYTSYNYTGYQNSRTPIGWIYDLYLIHEPFPLQIFRTVIRMQHKQSLKMQILQGSDKLLEFAYSTVILRLKYISWRINANYSYATELDT